MHLTYLGYDSFKVRIKSLSCDLNWLLRLLPEMLPMGPLDLALRELDCLLFLAFDCWTTGWILLKIVLRIDLDDPAMQSLIVSFAVSLFFSRKSSM